MIATSTGHSDALGGPWGSVGKIQRHHWSQAVFPAIIIVHSSSKGLARGGPRVPAACRAFDGAKRQGSGCTRSSAWRISPASMSGHGERGSGSGAASVASDVHDAKSNALHSMAKQIARHFPEVSKGDGLDTAGRWVLRPDLAALRPLPPSHCRRTSCSCPSPPC